MNEPQYTTVVTQPRRGGALVPILIGCAAFVIGVGGTLGYAQWQAQQAKIAEMAEIIQGIQDSGTVTRTEPLDLLSQPAIPQPQPAQQPAAPVVAAAPAVAPDEPVLSTADRLQALIDRADDPIVSAEIAKSEARRETMSVAIQGVNELVKAALLGNYELTIEQEDDKEVLRIWFPQKLIEQVRLEQVLSSAASAGMIAVNDSVKSSNGTYNGRVILFDLVERALNNGTAEERALGAKIEKEALALLAQAQPVAEQTTVDTTGQRFYTVQAGDSLAYIALQFYGNTNNFNTIFNANRDKLSSPERIQIGQRLLIPQI